MSNVGQRERLTQDRVVKFFVTSWVMTTFALGKIANAIAILKLSIYVASCRAAALGEGKKLYDQIKIGVGMPYWFALVCIKHVNFTTCSAIQTLKISAR